MNANVTVKISPTVTQEQLQDPRLKKLHREATNLFNSPNHFTKKYRSLLCLHEAGHIVYARLAGATEIGFHGPTIYWCSGCPHCDGDSPSISKASVSWTSPPNCDVIPELKSRIGGLIFREILSDTPNDAAAVWSDTKSARKWYQEHVSLDEEAFLQDLNAARQEIIEDLKDPKFVQLVWDTATEFQQAVFPTLPKITSATLRARRLGSWSPRTTVLN